MNTTTRQARRLRLSSSWLCAVLALVWGAACYQPSLQQLACDADHPCTTGYSCLRNVCVDDDGPTCAVDADCDDDRPCVLTLCDSVTCGSCSGWTGTCAGEGEGEEGEGEGEGEGEPIGPCGIVESTQSLRGSLTVDNATVLSVLSDKRDVLGSLVVDLDHDTSLAALSSLERVNGSLEVRGPFSDVSALASLRCVGGSVVFVDTVDSPTLPLLTSVPLDLIVERVGGLDGLGAIQVVGRHVRIDAPGLAGLGGLAALTSVGGRLDAVGGTSPPGFVGLGALRSVGGLALTASSTTSLAGLEGLVSIGSLTVTDNAISDFAPLAAVETIGVLEIDGAPGLVSLEGLSAVTSIGTLAVDNTPQLADYSGLLSLAAVEKFSAGANGPAALTGLETVTVVGDLRVERTRLTTLDGLSALSTVGQLEIRENSALVDISALAGLARVEGNVVVEANAALTTAGFAVVDGVGADVVIADNPELVDVGSTFGAEIGGSLRLQRLPSLLDPGLAGLVRVGGAVALDEVGLADLEALSSLSSVRSVSIADAPALANITGLSALRRATSISLLRVPSLSRLDGLANVDAGAILVVEGTGVVDLLALSRWREASSLIVRGNVDLVSVEGISQLRVAGVVEISNNPRLSSCSAERVAVAMGRHPDDVAFDNGGAGCFCAQ